MWTQDLCSTHEMGITSTHTSPFLLLSSCSTQTKGRSQKHTEVGEACNTIAMFLATFLPATHHHIFTTAILYYLLSPFFTQYATFYTPFFSSFFCLPYLFLICFFSHKLSAQLLPQLLPMMLYCLYLS